MEFGGSSGFKDFSFCFTRDIDQPLRVRMCGSLEFTARVGASDSCNVHSLQELYVSCQLFSGSRELSPLMRTAYKSFKTRWAWNEWIVLPHSYRELPADAWLALSVWEICGPQNTRVAASTAFPLFTKHSVLRSGRQKLLLWQDAKPDLVKTPSKSPQHDAMDHLEKMVKRHEEGEIPRVDWLDKLAFREIERINREVTASSSKMFLYIDLQKFDFPLVYGDEQPVLASSLLPLHLSLLDPELDAVNIVEAKHSRLVRSHRNEPLDRDLKPEATARDQLNAIIHYPPSQQLTSQEKDLLWKFRFYLSRDKRVLTKFLKCVVWTDPIETRQAVELLNDWSPVNIDDALELLGEGFQNKHVRAYAVKRIAEAGDEELLLYLLQLVQALKFEGMTEQSQPQRDSKLAEFLIKRGLRNVVLGNHLYWYLLIEHESAQNSKLFAQVITVFMRATKKINPAHYNMFRAQRELLARFASIARDQQLSKDPRPKKIERLRAYISDPKTKLRSFDEILLPLDPRVRINGVLPEKSSIFKSSLQPLRIAFSCAGGSEYQAIYKCGDDLRQDQLVIQMIMLMDKLLRKENLDLKLTPYRVLATGTNAGLVQFVDSVPLATILAENENSLLNYLRKHNSHSESTNTYGVHPQVMDTYVKSCAGYCVITYLLGVGDRHLDNLMLTTDGRLFHIDFGFILGRDPKPFPPPMKLAREMVDAMGGASSEHYKQFKAYCFIAFSILRKSANLILNLFALMVNAGIPDIQVEPDKAVMKVQEKFRLDLSEEEAIHHFQGLINESVSALFPQVIETIHKWAQYWRK
ncbi:atypical PIKK PI3K protein kinase [Thamnocephalis sphaerospora]|uniref:Phosphatidylinositol 3-kinase VPS34 n=1 Tax=Thamnocephalis sphaerospora TaxID=78915 RepID=A0A4P9XRS2_9FUNG|nr:atypical PIKK PI3K protein kinase [Thamnocephalis sphaerospora]|eukprot:RKP08211.1 atypical PIKK PI3K protein kinase [Thamnocephalis sphaerospora]